MKKLAKDIFGDVRAWCIAVLLTAIWSGLPEARQLVRRFYQWLISTETRAWSAAAVLLLSGIFLFWIASVFSPAWRLGKGERGIVLRILVGMKEAARQQNSPADNMAELKKLAREAGERFKR